MMYKAIQSKFQKYSASESVTCNTKSVLGSVAMVLWPAILTDDKKFVYHKGAVLVYDTYTVDSRCLDLAILE